MAEDTGAWAQPGSGSLPGRRGDVHARGRFKAENKYTKAKSYRVTRADLNKISAEASFGEVPIFDICFLGSRGNTEDRWVLLPYVDWLRLSNEASPPSTGFIQFSDPPPRPSEPDRKLIRWESEPFLCGHANENPATCPCDSTCYCRTHTCKDKG